MTNFQGNNYHPSAEKETALKTCVASVELDKVLHRFEMDRACHMSDADQNCWICGAPSTTGEHIIKKTDLKSEFGRVTQQAPLYFHREGGRSKRFGSFNAKVLKSPLCEKCNTSHTQRHDQA